MIKVWDNLSQSSILSSSASTLSNLILSQILTLFKIIIDSLTENFNDDNLPLVKCFEFCQLNSSIIESFVNSISIILDNMTQNWNFSLISFDENQLFKFSDLILDFFLIYHNQFLNKWIEYTSKLPLFTLSKNNLQSHVNFHDNLFYSIFLKNCQLTKINRACCDLMIGDIDDLIHWLIGDCTLVLDGISTYNISSINLVDFPQFQLFIALLNSVSPEISSQLINNYIDVKFQDPMNFEFIIVHCCFFISNNFQNSIILKEKIISFLKDDDFNEQLLLFLTSSPLLMIKFINSLISSNCPPLISHFFASSNSLTISSSSLLKYDYTTEKLLSLLRLTVFMNQGCNTDKQLEILSKIHDFSKKFSNHNKNDISKVKLKFDNNKNLSKFLLGKLIHYFNNDKMTNQSLTDIIIKLLSNSKPVISFNDDSLLVIMKYLSESYNIYSLSIIDISFNDYFTKFHDYPISLKDFTVDFTPISVIKNDILLENLHFFDKFTMQIYVCCKLRSVYF